jgi:DNA-binding transcriptional MocR family regulator
VALSHKVKLVSIATPQNPSGVAIPVETIRAVYAMMRERAPDAYLVVDEIYREAAYGDDPIAPTVLSLGPRVISVSSLSKCHGAPGLRLGWAITHDAALRNQLVTGKFNTAISNSPIDEALALRVFERRDAIIAERRRHLAACLERMQRWIDANGDTVEWIKPDAGPLCCVRLRQSAFHDDGVTRFYDAMAREGVLVSNGAWFGDLRRVFRVGFGHLTVPELDLALAALGACLNAASLAKTR